MKLLGRFLTMAMLPVCAATGMTFCPIEGTSEHPHEVADFEYSATSP